MIRRYDSGVWFGVWFVGMVRQNSNFPPLLKSAHLKKKNSHIYCIKKIKRSILDRVFFAIDICSTCWHTQLSRKCLLPVVPFVAAVAADCCCCCCCGSNMIKTCRGFCHHVQPPEFLGGSVTIMGYPFGESQTWYNIYINYIYIHTYFMLTIKNWFTFDLCNLKNHNEITIKWFRSVCCLGNPIDVWPHPINFSAKMQPTERLRRPIAGLKWSQPTPSVCFSKL